MIQARKDGTTSAKEQKIEDKTVSLPAQRPPATVRAVHALDQRRATFVTSTVGGAVILSDGSSIADGSTLQYRRVSLGPQLQHVVTPVQVQGAISSTSAPEASVANQRCTVTSTQDLTHILVAASSTNSSLHAVDLQSSVVTVAAPVAQPFQNLGNITNVVTSTQRAAITATTAQPQRIVLNSGTPDLYALRIAPSGSMPTQQIMVLDPASVTSDVTKVHSYSLASTSLGQKIVISTPGGTVQQRPAVPLRAGVKRQLQLTSPVRALTSNNSELVSHVCNVNKVLYGLVPYEASSSIPSCSKPKRMRLDKGAVPTKDPVKRKRVVDHLSRKLQCLRTKYYRAQAENYYLKMENSPIFSEITSWKKRVDPHLIEYLKSNRLDPVDDVKLITDSAYAVNLQSIHPLQETKAFLGDSSKPPLPGSSQSPLRSSQSSPSAQRAVGSPSPSKRQLIAVHKHSSKHNSISSVYDSQIGSQEEIVERAKQEAYVMQRVGDLRKEGLWSLKRLPKIAETPRIKAHYDYLLEEMAWLATDFAQERKWKKAAAKKCARMITKYFQEKEIKAEKAEKEEQLRLRKIAGLMAREVKQFWNNIEKLAEYKQQTWLEEKRKKVLDVHLNFIVDQTEKYSSWLTQGMNRKDSPDSSRASTPLPESAPSSPKKKQIVSHEPSDSDIDCESNVKEEEDVEIKFHEGDTSHGSRSSEHLSTQNDSKQSSSNDSFKSTKEELFKGKRKSTKGDDSDFEVSEEEEDDEQTLLEQEKEEESVDHVAEIKELEEEGQMSLEELRAKYASFSSDFEMDSTEQMSVDNDGEESDNLSEDGKSEENNESLLKMLTNEELEDDENANASKEISDIAATAESFQPKGNTLSTTQVCTKVPFLLKHSLREYQHIGLDWLNAMCEKKLNGILADEMGLGKTIQTISVLAHLACEKGVWGPHLIVVPTSVMLNWEMELKKWCPAFKILTYYGTPKERKQKRVGWTKPNAFHVCITSYKLVVQDHQSFRRKRWKYFILDEAHHIKNFKSQRWQMLLNFQSSHRLLLTGTPLQNNLMELWSLMHFLMPNVFQSHREFKEWFVNPFTGMIEGSHEYNESLIKRLHKVLRPFLLRRLKSEVEKQLPKKYEHVVVCRLSKRQRYLYDDFMSQTKTKETLATGNFMSVINILMQLRKVCNHPNMFEERPTVSPFLMDRISFNTASIAQKALEYNPFKQVNLLSLNLLLADLELSLTAFAAHRVRKFQVSRKLIVELDSMPEPPPPCPTVKMKVNFCNSQASSSPLPSTTMARVPPTVTRLPSSVSNRLSATVGPQPQRYMVIPGQSISRTATPAVVSQPTEQYTLQLLQPGSVLPPPKVNTPIASPPFLSNRSQNNTATVSPLTTVHNRPVGRVAPFNGHPSTTSEVGLVNQNHVQSTKSPVVHSLTKPVSKPDPVPVNKKNSLFYLEDVITAREEARKESLEALARINNQRCRACPIYGNDLVEAVTFFQNLKHPKCSSWIGPGYVNCLNAITCKDNPRLYWDHTTTLSDLILTPEDRVCQLIDIISRFVFVVPAVTAPPIDLHVSHPAPSQVNMEEINNKRISEYLTPACAFLHPIVSSMKNQFPDLRLIQYDCGKLQMLAQLLWDLKKDHHRVLIFTQMTRMLDILEQFLNYHGHTYLRLDGNTKVEQRQALMERFNADKRIFCFILSTRSGGIGVNLTGADTVIFYDSDWNPTMDAQAQDRCHRIGQTRDVHIYRLISERTIEENILKKAHQKRILGDLAIEGGNFTTAFFKKNTIHELFGFEVKVEVKKEEKKIIEEIPEKPSAPFSEKELEQALGMAEEESDLQAAQTASAEAVAELAEFDESIPLDNDSRDNEEKSPAEEELDKLMEQLTPVEKYALHFLESLQEPVGLEQLKLAEEEIEAQKKDWELGHLKALKEEEERRAGHLGDADSLFCSREASNQVYFSVNGQEEMPIWAPPTPPTNENDIYIDCSLAFWYEPSFMHEANLPPVFIKKEAKRLKMDPIASAVATTRKQKVRKEDVVNIPRSLFDRPSAAIIKMRREMKLQKVKGLIVGSSGLSKPITSFSSLKQPPVLLNKPPVDVHQERPDWLVQEDWAILQVVQELQGIPLNLTVLMPAQTPNWDLMSEGVQAITKNHRSAKSCRARYENVIVPREEGKILYDTNPKKQKKTKGIYKTKNNRPMKTSQLYIQDNNGAFSKIGADRFKCVMENAVKRKASERQTVAQTSKGTKVSSTLVENSINYDNPLTPMQIAANRAERIAREKQKSQPATAQTIPSATPVQAAVSQVTEQQIVSQRQVTQATTVAAATTNLITQQAVIASLAQSQQLQQVQLSKANLQPGTVTSVSLAKSLTSGIMVNTPTISATATLANLTKALGQAGVTSISTQGAAQSAAIAAALSNAGLRNQRAAAVTAAPTITMQEMVARAATSAAAGTSSAPAVVSVANLAAVQLAAASQRLAGTTLSPATTAAAVAAVNQLNTQSVASPRNMAQLQALRQSAILRHREQQSLKQQQQHMKRLQSVPQQQTAAKLAISTTGTVTLAAPAGQPRVSQQVAMKQSVGRPMTEAEMAQLMKRQQLQQQQKQQVSITGGTLVKTVSAPLTGTSSLTIPVSAVTMGGVNINVSVPQGKAGAAKAATTLTNQQIRQLQIQQQMLQARKGKVTANITQLAKIPGKTTGLPASMNAVQIVQHNPQVGGTQQVKGLPTAIAVQQIQQAMKQAIPQSLPVVVTATPSLPGVQQTSSTTLRGEPSSVKAQTTTLPSTTLTTSGVLKGGPAVVVGQQQTATLLQQVAASTAAGLTPITLAVRAGQQQQQVQVQVQQATPRLQLAAAQPGQPVAASILSADQPSPPTHVVINSVPVATTTATISQASAANVVHAAIQAAKQQVAAAQQKASPYTMRLRNPPK